MFALPPNQASGVPLPTARIAAGIPAVGGVVGELLYDTITRRGVVWTGSNWLDISASAIVRFPTDAALKADTTQVTGTYAVSQATGNPYVYTATGWLKVGTQEYPDVRTLLADNPAHGTVGLAMDEGSLWERGPTAWQSLSMRELVDTDEVFNWRSNEGGSIGDRALAVDVNVQYIRTAHGWRPASIYEDTEAAIKAATWAINGQQAISTDTGQTFVYVRESWSDLPAAAAISVVADQAARLAVATPATGKIVAQRDTQHAWRWDGSAWVDLDEIHIYATDADRLAAEPPVDTVALVRAAGVTALSGAWSIRTAGQWQQDPIQHYATEAALLADSPPDGTLAWGDDTGLVYARHGGQWTRVNSPTITIGAHPTTPAAGDLNYRAGRGLQVWDGTAWQEVGGSAVTVATTAPAGPQAGDLWYATNRLGRFKVYDGNSWQETSGVKYTRGAIASRPAYSNSDYGDIFEDSTTGELWMALRYDWRLISSAGSSVAKAPPTKDWLNQLIALVPNRVTKLSGRMYVNGGGGGAHLILAFNKQGGGKLMNSDFTINKTGAYNFTANNWASRDYDGGGGGGNGWYGCSFHPVKPGSSAGFDLTATTIGDSWCIEVRASFVDSSNDLCHSVALFEWNQPAHPLSEIYFSTVQGQSSVSYNVFRIS